MEGTRKGLRMVVGLVLTAGLMLVLAGGLRAQDNEEEFEDFSQVSLEDLLNVEVYSASKYKQSAMKSPNAITVITAEDIRRAGVRSVPEALRLAPGVFVAQKSGNKWEVTIGGFAWNSYSNKLLVLIDGVSVYTTLFGGVEWDKLPVTIDEIERIEVIRGPGGVLYGANAANGVINIITREPGTESKGYVNGVLGTQGVEEGNAAMSLASEDGKYSSRLAVSYQEDTGLGMKSEIHDGQRLHTASARTVLKPGEDITISLDGRYRGGYLEAPWVSASIKDNTERFENSIIRARVEQQFDNGGQWYLQSFYARKLQESLDEDRGKYFQAEDSNLIDVEGQAVIPYEAAGSHRTSVGGGWRRWAVDFYQMPDNENLVIINGYVNDEWAMSEQWILNTGVKWEHVSNVDPTWQWRAALLFLPTPEHSFRISAANSFRSPSLLEENFQLQVPVPAALDAMIIWPDPTKPHEFVRVTGNDELSSEEVTSYEFGYRGIWFERVNVDLAYSYKEYTNLISMYYRDYGYYANLAIPNPFPPPPFFPGPPVGPLGQQISFNDNGSAHSQSIEAGVDARITDDARLLANFTHIDIAVTGKNADVTFENNTPRNFGRVALLTNLPAGYMVDLSAAYVDKLQVKSGDDFNEPFNEIDDYWRLDARVAQRIKLARGDELEWGLIGTNLGQEYHDEYMDSSSAFGTDPYQVRRAYYGYLEYKVK